jgi:hypothetical protein
MKGQQTQDDEKEETSGRRAPLYNIHYDMYQRL